MNWMQRLRDWGSTLCTIIVALGIVGAIGIYAVVMLPFVIAIAMACTMILLAYKSVVWLRHTPTLLIYLGLISLKGLFLIMDGYDALVRWFNRNTKDRYGRIRP